MIYELRVYTIHPGKMAAIHERFSTVTLDLFEKHGIHVTDFWEDANNNKLYYVVPFASRERRDAAWEAFGHDEAWQQAKAESEANGKIVERVDSIFMTKVPYWPRD